METVVIVIHLMVIIALVALVLMQRSEGGALGIGGGGNFLSTRGQGNVLTRSTAILAAAFFATSILLTILARVQERPSDILDAVPAAAPPASTAPGTGTGEGQGILDELQGLSQPQTAPVPAGDATAPAVTPDASGALPAPAATAPAPAPAAPATPDVPTTQ